MSTTTTPTAGAGAELHDTPLPVRARIAAAWTSLMFFYIYVDYLHLYKPGALEEILSGVVFEFDISQTFVVASLVIVGTPALMIALTTALPARACRTLNLVVASVWVPITLFNVSGGSYLVFYGLGVTVETALLVYVLRSAWTWPRAAA